MTSKLSQFEWEDQSTQVIQNNPYFDKLSINPGSHPEAENAISITGDIKKYNTLYKQLPESEHTIIDVNSIINDNELGSGFEKLIVQWGNFPIYNFETEEQQVINLLLTEPPFNSYSGTHHFENNTHLQIQHIHESDLLSYLSQLKNFSLALQTIIPEGQDLWTLQYIKSYKTGFKSKRIVHLQETELEINCPYCNSELTSESLVSSYNQSIQKDNNNTFICSTCYTSFLQKERPLHYLDGLDPLQKLQQEYQQLFKESLEQEQELPRLPYKLFGTTEEITMFENPYKESDKYGNISYWIYLDKKVPVIYYDLEEKFLDQSNSITDGIPCDICDSEHTKKYAIKGGNYSPEHGHSDTTVVLCSNCHKHIMDQIKDILNSRDDLYEIIAGLL